VLDPDHWERVVTNLLSNALKFTFAGRIGVRLTGEDDGVRLEVTDTGVGIPAEELPRLFERFHRVSGTRARSHEGSGIGLALVRELTALLGGQVEVTSEVGVGTCFVVRVPYGAADDDASTAAPGAALHGSRRRGDVVDGADGPHRTRPRGRREHRPGCGCSSPTTTPTCATTSRGCCARRAGRSRPSATGSRPCRRCWPTRPTCC
jgi:anti-sigma regulatory factor (Ser/Thr protein kinase)